MNTSVIVSRKVVTEVSCPSVSYPAVSCDAIKMSTSNKMTTSRDEIFTAEVDHLIQRSFGDEVLMRTIERKCLCVKQLKSNSPVLRMNMVHARSRLHRPPHARQAHMGPVDCDWEAALRGRRLCRGPPRPEHRVKTQRLLEEPKFVI